jgi:hypothetical protein
LYAQALTDVSSLLVFLADTWLHLTTTSTNFLQVDPTISPPNYSIVLNSTCKNASDVFGSAPLCTVRTSADGSISFLNASASYVVLGNISDLMTVATITSDVPFVYLGIPSSPELAMRDYSASTFGMQTQCAPVSRKCSLNALDGASTPYYCTPDFQGV